MTEPQLQEFTTSNGDPHDFAPAGPGETSVVLSEEDAKLVVLARGARGRAAAAEGAAVRDQDGRTYAAATVTLPSLKLTALQAAVATAVASGAIELEAAVIVGSAVEADADSVAAVRDMQSPLLVLAAGDGTVRARIAW